MVIYSKTFRNDKLEKRGSGNMSTRDYREVYVRFMVFDRLE